ncbi:MAG: CNNM domain-containing protein [Alistipes shahii]
MLTGIYSGDALAAKFGRELAALRHSLRTATVAAQVTIVIVVTYLTLIFGELVPKRIGMNAAEKIACAVARPMRALSVRGLAVRMAAFAAAPRASPACWASTRSRCRRSPRRRYARSSRRAPRTAKCRRSNRRSWAASFRWATARSSRS